MSTNERRIIYKSILFNILPGSSHAETRRPKNQFQLVFSRVYNSHQKLTVLISYILWLLLTQKSTKCPSAFISNPQFICRRQGMSPLKAIREKPILEKREHRICYSGPLSHGLQTNDGILTRFSWAKYHNSFIIENKKNSPLFS